MEIILEDLMEVKHAVVKKNKKTKQTKKIIIIKKKRFESRVDVGIIADLNILDSRIAGKKKKKKNYY